jgi:2'-5' RNA ligase
MGRADLQAAMTNATNIRLWLLPIAADTADFARQIERLSARLGTPPFLPHFTLAPCVGDLYEANDRARHLASHLAPTPITLRDIAHSEQYFRCVFALAEQSDGLQQAHRTACRYGGVLPDPNFLPHLSFVYGNLPASTREGLCSALQHFAGRRVIADRIAVCHIAGKVEEWEIAGVFELTG